MRVWFILIAAMVLAGCSSHRAPPPNPRLADSITVVANLNEQLRNWRGAPYRYGGMTPRGVDCSGFVVRTFRDKFAMQLPRETREQAEIGTRIDKSDLLPGDLVFFKTGSGEILAGEAHLTRIWREKGAMLPFLIAITLQFARVNPLLKALHWQQEEP